MGVPVSGWREHNSNKDKKTRRRNQEDKMQDAEDGEDTLDGLFGQLSAGSPFPCTLFAQAATHCSRRILCQKR